MTRLHHHTLTAVILSLLALSGCGGDRRQGTQTHEHETQETHQGAPASTGSAEAGEHEVLPDDIVELNAEQIKAAGLTYGRVDTLAMSGVIRASGTVRATPQNTASVSMPYGGFVRSCTLLPGAAVRKGQVLATIENTEFVDLQQNYLDIRHRLAYVEAEYTRDTELYKNNVSSQKSVQQSRSEYQSLKTQMKGIEQKLLVLGIQASALTEEKISATLPVRAPISGHLATANISIGKYFSPTDVLFTIVNPNDLLLELTLFENDARAALAGSRVLFSVNNETHRHTAVIYQVGSAITSGKTYTAYATVRPPCPNILPGMFVNAEIERKTRPAQTVPDESVVSIDGKHYILVHARDKSENGKSVTEFRFIEVGRGDSRDGMTEIHLPSGLDPSHLRVVVRGAYTVLSAKRNAGEMTCG